jgi:hypothetical protein
MSYNLRTNAKGRHGRRSNTNIVVTLSSASAKGVDDDDVLRAGEPNYKRALFSTARGPSGPDQLWKTPVFESGIDIKNDRSEKWLHQSGGGRGNGRPARRYS